VDAEVKGRIAGVAASEGVSVGPVFVHARRELEPERENISEDEVEEELARLQSAVEAVVKKLSQTAERLRESGSEKEAGIFDAHVEMAEDPEFHSEVEERVRSLESPEAAVLAVGEEYAGMFAEMEDEYMAARADDVRDVASQIAADLMGSNAAGLEMLEEPSVILSWPAPSASRRWSGSGRRWRKRSRLRSSPWMVARGTRSPTRTPIRSSSSSESKRR
jgi:phosphotransferase system enzyme I (PtsI)